MDKIRQLIGDVKEIINPDLPPVLSPPFKSSEEIRRNKAPNETPSKNPLPPALSH